MRMHASGMNVWDVSPTGMTYYVWDIPCNRVERAQLISEC